MSSDISQLISNVPHPSLMTFEGEGWFPDWACEQPNETMTLAKKMWGVTVTVDSDLNLKAKETAGRISNIFARFLLFFPALISLMWNFSLVNDSLTHQVYRCYVGQQTIAGVPKDDTFRLSVEVRKLVADDKNMKEVVHKIINIKDLHKRERIILNTANKVNKVNRKQSQWHFPQITALLYYTSIPNNNDINLKQIMDLLTKIKPSCNKEDYLYIVEAVLTELKPKCNEQDYLYIVNAVYDENNEKNSFLLRERGIANYNALNCVEAKNDLDKYKKSDEFENQSIGIQNKVEVYLNSCNVWLKGIPNSSL